MQWLLTIRNLPAPEQRWLTPRQEADKARMLQTWLQHVGPLHGDGTGDYEDFWEQAYRLQAALDSFGTDSIWLYVPGLRDGMALHLGSAELAHPDTLRHLPVYGMQRSTGHMPPGEGQQSVLADAYSGYGAFIRNAGREVHLCGFNTPDSDLVSHIRDMLARGVTRFFVKVTLPKYGIYRLTLPADADEATIRRALFAEADYALIHLEGVRGAFLLQEDVSMQYEYRVFVAGQRPVTGAGAVVEHTPLDNAGPAFSALVRRCRATGSDVEDASAQVFGQILPFAQTVIDQLKDEVPELQNYALDIALGADGKPLVVELNSMLNRGLYASLPRLVTDSLAAWAASISGGLPTLGRSRR